MLINNNKQIDRGYNTQILKGRQIILITYMNQDGRSPVVHSRNNYIKHHLTPHNRNRQYIQEYLRLPMHRNEIIKKIQETTFRGDGKGRRKKGDEDRDRSRDSEHGVGGKRWKEEGRCVGVGSNKRGWKREYGKSQFSERTMKSDRNSHQKEIIRVRRRVGTQTASLKTMRASLPTTHNSLRISTDSKQYQKQLKENNTGIKQIIRRLIQSRLFNPTKQLKRKHSSVSSEDGKNSGLQNLKSTQQYYHLKRYYEEKYS